jgi:amino acid adenylation domain-containing protein
MLWNAADVQGHHAAIVEPVGTTTYAALRARAGRIAHVLSTCGVQPGDRVAILIDRGAEAAAAYFGALAVGAIAVIVNERLRPRQVEYILRRASVRVLLTRRTLLAEHQRDLNTDTAIVDLASVSAIDAPWVPVPAGEKGLAQIIFTSGSSGLPKGVVFSHRALTAAIDAIVAYLGLERDERIMSLLPFSSVYGLNQLLCAIRTGSSLVVATSPLPARIAVEAQEQKVTVLAAVPPLWLQLLATPAFRDVRIPSLRVAQNAGGHLPVEAVRQLRASQPHARLFLQYGMTETFRSTYLTPEEVDAHPDSMGREIPGGSIAVVDDDGTVCGPGEIGELVFRGPTVAEGYWDDPEQTARTFRSDPTCADAGNGASAVYSGDLVRRDAEGRLYYVGRRDRMIKSLGFRIGPDEIVDVLYASNEILEAAIATEPDVVRGERIVAYAVLRPDGSAERLKQFARLELPRHMQPSRIELRPALPRLPSGKYDLHVLRSPVTRDACAVDVLRSVAIQP